MTLRIYLVDCKIRVGKEYNQWALFNGVFIISDSISTCVTGLREKASTLRDFGRYSKNSFCKFGSLEARLRPIEEKYLFIMSGSSEELYEIWIYPGCLSKVICLIALRFIPSQVFLMLLRLSSK